MGTEKEACHGGMPTDFYNKLMSSERCEKKLHSLTCEKNQIEDLEIADKSTNEQ